MTHAPCAPTRLGATTGSIARWAHALHEEFTLPDADSYRITGARMWQEGKALVGELSQLADHAACLRAHAASEPESAHGLLIAAAMTEAYRERCERLVHGSVAAVLCVHLPLSAYIDVADHPDLVKRFAAQHANGRELAEIANDLAGEHTSLRTTYVDVRKDDLGQPTSIGLFVPFVDE